MVINSAALRDLMTPGSHPLVVSLHRALAAPQDDCPALAVESRNGFAADDVAAHRVAEGRLDRRTESGFDFEAFRQRPAACLSRGPGNPASLVFGQPGAKVFQFCGKLRL